MGARRREGFLLAAYAVLLLIGVWTVVAAELGDPESGPARSGEVAPSVQKSK